MIDRHNSLENINASYAKQPIRFHIVTESGTELMRNGRQIDLPYEIGSLFNLGGKTWVVMDIWDPLSTSDNKWTIVVRPETSDSEQESLG